MTRSSATRWWVRLAAVATASLALAACGSDDQSGDSSASDGGATTTRAAKPTGATIRIGNVGTYSGPVGSGAAYVPELIKTWTERVNDAGGINGHPVEVISQDDAGDTTKSLAAVKNLVESKKVLAFTANQYPTTAQAAAPYLAKARIPVVGGDGTVETWFSNPMFFSVTQADPVVGIGQAAAAKRAGAKKLALWVCDAGAPCTAGAKVIGGAIEKSGVPIVNRQTVGLRQADFQANCLAGKKSGADAVQTIADPSTIARIMTSCLRVGYRPTFLAYTVQVTNALAAVAGAKVYGVQQTFPYFLKTGSPAIEEWAEATKDAPEAEIGSKLAGTWASLKLLEKVLRDAVPAGGTPSTAAILDALYRVKDETLGGLTIPLTYTEGKPSPPGDCWFDFELADGKFSAPSGSKAQCASPSGA